MAVELKSPPARDPREEPRARDIIRFGGIFNARFYEVLEHDPKFAATDVSFICEGIEGQRSLRQWQGWTVNAEVIHVAED